MKLYLVWYGVEPHGAFLSWEGASQYIDKRLSLIENESGYRLMSDFVIEEYTETTDE
jgi:hypothetical protein